MARDNEPQPRLPYSTILMVSLALGIAYFVPGMLSGWEDNRHNKSVVRLPIDPHEAVEIVKAHDTDGDGVISLQEAQYIVSFARDIPSLEVSRTHPEVVEFVGTCSELVGKLMYGRNDTAAELYRLKVLQEEEDRLYEQQVREEEQRESQAQMDQRLATEQAARQQEEKARAEKEANDDQIRAKHAAAEAQRTAAQRMARAKEKLQLQATQSKKKAQREAAAEKKSKIGPLSRLAKHCADAQCGRVPSADGCAADSHSAPLTQWATKAAVDPFSLRLECWDMAHQSEATSVAVSDQGSERNDTIAAIPYSSCLSSDHALTLLNPLWATPDSAASPKARAATRQEVGHELDMIEEMIINLQPASRIALAMMERREWGQQMLIPAVSRVAALWAPEIHKVLFENHQQLNGAPSEELSAFFSQLLGRTTEWQKQIEPLLKAVEQAQGVELAWTRPRFLQAFQTVVSHAVSTADGLILCPLLTHVQAVHPTEASSRLQLHEGKVLLRATVPLQAGSLLTLPYNSSMSNWELLLKHGVVDADNMHETATVSTGNAPALLTELVKIKLLPHTAPSIQLVALDKLLQSASAAKLAPLRAAQYSVRSWVMPTEMLAAARLLVVPPQHLETASCLSDVLAGRQLDANTELRAAALVRMQVEQQLYGFPSSLAEDRMALKKSKGPLHMALLMRIRRKEVLDNLIGTMQQREGCLEAVVMKQAGAAECQRLVRALTPHCGHRKSFTGVGMMKSKKEKLASRLLGQHDLEKKWRIRRGKLRKDCARVADAECSKWTARIDQQLQLVKKRVKGLCGGDVIHSPAALFSNVTKQLQLCGVGE